MPKFVTIGYGDEAGYRQTAPEIRKAAHAHDRQLVEGGALVGVAQKPTQVRNADAAGVRTENSAFMSSPLPIAGWKHEAEFGNSPKRASMHAERLASFRLLSEAKHSPV